MLRLNRAYWIGMALCGEGVWYDSGFVYFGSRRVHLYPDPSVEGGMWGCVEWVPFEGY